MGRTVSIRDIAKVAGVSHTTVSRALHHSPLIREDVAEQIRQVAYEMGYTPNAVAQSLKSRRTNTVGVVVTSITDPFLGRVVRGINEVAQRCSISVFLATSDNDADQEMAIIETFHQRRVDGILVAAAQISAQYANRLARINVPTVLLNQQAETRYEMLHSVSIDDYNGAKQAMQHLIALGHRSIGYLGAGNRPRSNRLRLQAYREILADVGIEVCDAWVAIAHPKHRYSSDDVADGKALLPALLDQGITAVFCYNDMLAVGALLACRERGITVPQELSIVGFDDIELAQYVTPALTTIYQPKLSLGQTAMEMLLDLLAERPVEDKVLPTEFVPRSSTAIARGQTT